MTIRKILDQMEKDPIVFPWSSEKETCEFIQSIIALNKPTNVLELGTFVGYSTLHMAAALPARGRIYTVDLTDRFTKYYNKLPEAEQKKIIILHKSTHQAFRDFPKKKKFQLIFIDADHRYSLVFHDVLQSLMQSEEGTIIVLHDALNPIFPGIYRTIRHLKFLNLVSLNQIFDILILKTPQRSNFPSSGVCVIKVKKASSLRFRLIVYILRFIGFCIPAEKPMTYDHLLSDHVRQNSRTQTGHNRE